MSQNTLTDAPGRRTALVWHERYMWHDTGSAVGVVNTALPPLTGMYQPGIHAENAETKRRLKNLLDAHEVTRALWQLDPFEVPDEVLLRFHTADYIERVGRASRGFGEDLGDAAPVGPGSDPIARLAVGGAIHAMEAVMTGAVDNAYVLSRPPGHHAVRDMGMGFCLYNNIGLAVLDAKARGLVERVAIVDWDTHHGNGTEQVFAESDEVLTISMHQDMLYPTDAGHIADIGTGAGEGYNINVPLPPGSGGGAWIGAMDRIVLPALLAFRPELIIVACGYDASYFDPLSHQMLLACHYRQMTERMVAAAQSLCGGRLVVCHEGGYNEWYVPICGVGVIDELRGVDTDLLDPNRELADLPVQSLQPHQDAVLTACERGPLAKLRGRCGG